MRSAKAKAASSSDPRVTRELAKAFLELLIASSGRFQAIAAELEITPVQAKALFELERPLMMSEVAEMAHCEPSHLTGIVDKLEARGLVERRGAPTDRRIKMVS
ncbi:MAG: MarR family winged helix-turn-helix transcriptional regulator, partial [Deltaproteobacteria bacterium]